MARNSTIWQGSYAKTLTEYIRFGKATTVDIVHASADPTSSAFDANEGSLYLRHTGSGGELYIKQDGGSSTNWERVSTEAAGAALTAGSVVFADSNGDLTQDNANFFWDDANNRLGIGIAVPLKQLDIAKDSGGSAGTATEFLIRLHDTGAASDTWDNVNPYAGIIWTNLDGSGVGSNAERAGIHVSINGTNGSTTKMEFKTETGGGLVVPLSIARDVITMAAGEVIISGGDFTVDTTTLFVDATNNRVGVGTITPAVTLDVVGGITSSGTISAEDTFKTNGSNTMTLDPSDASNTINFGGDARSLGGKLQAVVGTAGAPGLSFMSDSDTGFFRAATNDIGVTCAGAETVRFLNAGNVGFGIVAPVAVLHVFKNTTAVSEPVAYFEQDHVTAAIPVIEIQQDDISEGTINFIASDRGAVPTSTVNSVASVRVEVSGTVYVLACHVDQ